VALTYIGYVSALSQTPVPLFYWKGQNTLAATTGTDPTFTRATAATFEDFEGLIKTVESREPRFQGARRVENLQPYSEDFTKEVTTTSGNTATATSVTFTDANGYRYKNSMPYGRTIKSGETVLFSVVLSSDDMTQIGMDILTSTGGDTETAIPLTSTPTRYSISYTHAGADATFSTVLDNRAPSGAGELGTINVAEWQLEDVTGQTNQNPSEYVSTGVGTGPELVTNGDFATDISGWTSGYASPTISWDSSSKSLKMVSDVYATALTPITLVAGQTYVFSATFSGTSPAVWIASSPTGHLSTMLFVSGGSITYTEPIGGLRYVAVQNRSGDGLPVYFDNVSVKQAEHGANVDGIQYFNTLNANTVTGNVVTEAVGSPLTRANTQFGELNGGAGDYFSTPNVVTTWGELDVRVRVTHSRSTTYNIIASKHVNAIGQSWILWNDPNGVPFAAYYNAIGGTVNIPSAGSAPFAVGQIGWIRLTIDTATGDCKYWTADGNLESPAISDYTQLGTTKNPAGGATAINITTAPFWVGSYASAANPSYNGKFYRSQVFNEIDGTTPVVDFTAGSYVSGSTLVSSTSGETWTLEGNASIFQPPVDASGPFGYLAEKASTNLVLQSEDFTGWSIQGATVSTDVAVAPDGATTMDRLAVNTTHTIHRVYQANGTASVGTNYTTSAYIKDDGAGFGGVTFYVYSSGTHYAAVVVDLSTGLVTDTRTEGSGGLVASGCDDVGNGVYRVWVSGNSTAGPSGRYAMVFASNAAVPAAWNDGVPSYTAVAGEDILIWGAQAELGTYPTSYIPTTTTAVTRNGDLLKLANGIVDGSLGTVSFEASSGHNVTGGSVHTLFSIFGNNRMFASAINGTGYYPVVGGVLSASGVSRYNTAVQSAMTYNGLDATVYHGPVSNAGTLPSTPMPVQANPTIGSANNALQPDYSFREVKIFDSELTAAEVGDL
jgi:hypothetical protein